MSIVKDKKAQRLVLALGLSLFIMAAIFRLMIARNDPAADIVSMLRSYGYSLRDSDLYIAGDYPNTSISDLLEHVDLKEAVALSKQAGFPSDIERVGDVVLILARSSEDEIITLYALDGEMELCFIQFEDSSRLGALGE